MLILLRLEPPRGWGPVRSQRFRPSGRVPSGPPSRSAVPAGGTERADAWAGNQESWSCSCKVERPSNSLSKARPRLYRSRFLYVLDAERPWYLSSCLRCLPALPAARQPCARSTLRLRGDISELVCASERLSNKFKNVKKWLARLKDEKCVSSKERRTATMSTVQYIDTAGSK